MTRRHPTSSEREAAAMDDATLRSHAFRLPREIAGRQSLLSAVLREQRRRKKAAKAFEVAHG